MKATKTKKLHEQQKKRREEKLLLRDEDSEFETIVKNYLRIRERDNDLFDNECYMCEKECNIVCEKDKIIVTETKHVPVSDVDWYAMDMTEVYHVTYEEIWDQIKNSQDSLEWVFDGAWDKMETLMGTQHYNEWWEKTFKH